MMLKIGFSNFLFFFKIPSDHHGRHGDAGRQGHLPPVPHPGDHERRRLRHALPGEQEVYWEFRCGR